MYVSVEKKKSSSVLIKFSAGVTTIWCQLVPRDKKKKRADKLQAGLLRPTHHLVPVVESTLTRVFFALAKSTDCLVHNVSHVITTSQLHNLRDAECACSSVVVHHSLSSHLVPIAIV